MEEQLEEAVAIALSPDVTTSPAKRMEALAFCEAFKNSPNGWRLSCCQFLNHSSLTSSSTFLPPPNFESPTLILNQVVSWKLEPRFWYLQIILDRIESLTPAERTEVRGFLGSYIETSLLQRCAELRHWAGPDVTNIAPSEPIPILAKVAQIFVRLLFFDFPSAWPTAFTALLGIWSCERDKFQARLREGSGAADVLCRYVTISKFLLIMLEVFDDGVVSETTMGQSDAQRVRATEIKDALRERDIMLLADALLSLAEGVGSEGVDQLSKGGNIGALIDLRNNAFIVMAKLVSWVDVQVIANPRVMALVAAHVGQESGSGVAATEVLAAILQKKMDSAQRIVLIHQLRVLQMLKEQLDRSGLLASRSNSPPFILTSDSPTTRETFLKSFLWLFNLVGRQLVDAVTSLRKGYDCCKFVENYEEELRRLGGIEAAGPNPFYTPITTPAIWRQLQEAAWSLLEDQALACAIAIFSHPAFDVAASIEEFLSDFLRLARHMSIDDSGNPAKPPRVPLDSPMCPLYIPLSRLRPLLTRLFSLFPDKFTLPVWFDASKAAEDERQEKLIEFRNSIVALYKKLFDIDPDSTTLEFLSFIGSRAEELCSPNQPSSSHPEKEGLLAIVYHSGTQLKDLDKVVTLPSHPLYRLLATLFNSIEKWGDADCLQVLLCDLIQRFSPFFYAKGVKSTTDYYQVALRTLLSFSMHSRSSALTEKATNTLQKFVKSNTGAATPYAADILDSISKTGMLEVTILQAPALHQRSPPGKTWTYSDQERCLELCGILWQAQSGDSGRDPIGNKLKTALQSWRSSIETALTLPPLSAMDYIARLLDAAACIRRPFMSDPDDRGGIWSAWFDGILIALRNFPEEARVRASAVQLLRYNLALGRNGAPSLQCVALCIRLVGEALALTMRKCPLPELTQLTSLLAQACLTLKQSPEQVGALLLDRGRDQAPPLLKAVLLCAAEYIEALGQGGSDLPPQDIPRHIAEARKDVYSMIQAIAETAPRTMLGVLHEEIKSKRERATSEKEEWCFLVTWLARGTLPCYASPHGAAAAASCLIAWEMLTNACIKLPEEELGVLEEVLSSDSAVLVIEGALSLLQFLNLENVQNIKFLSDVCGLIRSWSGHDPGGGLPASLKGSPSYALRRQRLHQNLRAHLADKIKHPAMQVIDSAPTLKDAANTVKRLSTQRTHTSNGINTTVSNSELRPS